MLPGPFGAFSGLFREGPGVSGVFGGLRGPPPRASGGLRGLPGASGASEAPGVLGIRMLGLVAGFAFFGLRPYPCLADPKFQHFPGLLQYRPGQGCSQDHAQKTPEAKVVGFRVS